MTTDPQSRPDIVWVTVERVRQSRIEWTYTLSDFESGTAPCCLGQWDT